jgi:hypothetical protein
MQAELAALQLACMRKTSMAAFCSSRGRHATSAMSSGALYLVTQHFRVHSTSG